MSDKFLKITKKMNRKTLAALAALLVSGIMCLAAAGNCLDSREGVIEDYEWQETEERYQMQCFQMGVDKGTHTLIIGYESEHDLSYRLADMAQNDGENRLGREIASGILPGGENQLGVEFELTQTAEKLTLYVESTDSSARPGYWILETPGTEYGDFGLMFFCVAVGILFLYCTWGRENGKYLITVVAAAVILTAPCLNGYLQIGDDLEFHMSRIRGIAGALQSGQFPVRLSTAFASGYGMSVDMMYPELFLYIPAVLYLAGVSLLTSYKFLILCVNIATACIGLYSFSRLLRSEKCGVIVALLYLLNPYRLVNIFFRAAVGEMLAQIFLPLLLYGLYELLFGNAKKWWITLIAATGIIQSHILSIEMSLFFAAGAVILGLGSIVRNGWRERMAGAVKTAVSVVAVNLWFLVPFLDHFTDNNTIQQQATNLQDSAVDLYDIFHFSVKYISPYVNGGVKRQEFVSIGPVLLLGSLVFVYLAFVKKKMDQRMRRIGTACLGAGVVSCYLATRFFPWRIIQNQMEWLYDILGIIQFPWRFLAYAALFLSVTTGIAMAELLHEKKEAAAAILGGLALFGAVTCMDLYTVRDVYISDRSEIKAYGWTSFDYFAQDTDGSAIQEQGDTVHTDRTAVITGYVRDGVEISFDYTAEGKTLMILPIYDYGMHEVWLNGEMIETAQPENHQVTVEIPEEHVSGHIEVRYAEPLAYKISTGISIGAVACLAAVGIFKKRRNK